MLTLFSIASFSIFPIIISKTPLYDVVSKNIENEAELEMLHEALNKLPPRERKIMDLRFGFSTGNEMTQKEVADTLGISQSYISRLEKKIMQSLRKKIEEKI